MSINEKIEEELISLNYDKKEALQKFEEAKKELVNIITKADAKTINELEEKYQVATDIKRYANSSKN
jgi:hypothetical protein